jgi:hypothetical protein
MTETVRYYRSQVFVPSEETTEAEAKAAGYYVRAHHADGRVTRAEVFEAGKLAEVVYHRDGAADAAFIEGHRARYGARPFRIVTPPEDAEGTRRRRIFHHTADGALAEITTEHLSEAGELIEETRARPDGRPFERLRYEYADGELTDVVNVPLPDEG